ncbi:MAG: hypothetical protein KF778_00820 [Rhodocyclaceae bacterium]|nr:hypothetical protein [Rhodocyclaceae bacterium]MBX3666921.1 hypothetical protein [Rhodocyclaceae bacterium]
MKCGLHPASTILAWLALATSLSRLSGLSLALALLVLLCAAFVLARHRLVRLIRRARFLLLSLVAVFAWASPGQYMFPAAGAFSPTLEGAHLALAHVAIIVAMLSMVALLLELLPPVELASGCATLIGRALPVRGADERLLARLCLVMEYVEGPAVHWRDWLNGAAMPQEGPPLQVPDFIWRGRDSLVGGLSLLAAAAAVLML